MTVSAAEAERQVEDSRGELDRTMEAIRDKMTPGELFREAKRAMGGTGDQLVAKAIDQAKENPLPFALMGLGLAWLASSAKEKRERPSFKEHRSFAPSQPGFIDKAQGAAGGAMGSLSDKAGGLSEKAQGAAEQAGDAMSQAKEAVAGSAGRTMNQAREQVASIGASASQTAQDVGRRTRDAASDLFDREPLLIGVLGLFVGLALGAGAPATEAEKKALAPVATKLTGTAKEVLQGGLDQASAAAQAAYGTVKDELKKGDGAESPEENAQPAFRAGASGAQGQLPS